MTDIIFYTNPESRGQIAHWFLEELGEPYETRWLAYGEAMKTSEYLAIHPLGKVPALEHKGRVITETAAICAYLAAVYPDKKLRPTPNDPALADYYRWMFFAAGPLEMVIMAHSMQWKSGEEHARMLGYGTPETALDAIEEHLRDREFICDSGFTAADVYLGNQLMFGLEYQMIQPRDTFKTYTGKLMQREAFQRCLQICEQQKAAMET